MKFRVAFSISKTERKLRLRFWKWDIWRLDTKGQDNFSTRHSGEDGNLSDKGGFISAKKKESGEYSPDTASPFLQALFYPEVESRIMRVGKTLSSWVINLFSVSFPILEIHGSLGDPFYDSIALGMSQGAYYPDWENESADWSAKGEALLKTGFFHLLLFSFVVLYEFATLSFILWRGARLAKKNPNGENLSSVRRWLFLKAKEAV